MANNKNNVEKHIGEQRPLTQNTPADDTSPGEPNQSNNTPLKPISTIKIKKYNKP